MRYLGTSVRRSAPAATPAGSGLPGIRDLDQGAGPGVALAEDEEIVGLRPGQDHEVRLHVARREPGGSARVAPLANGLPDLLGCPSRSPSRRLLGSMSRQLWRTGRSPGNGRADARRVGRVTVSPELPRRGSVDSPGAGGVASGYGYPGAGSWTAVGGPAARGSSAGWRTRAVTRPRRRERFRPRAPRAPGASCRWSCRSAPCRWVRPPSPRPGRWSGSGRPTGAGTQPLAFRRDRRSGAVCTSA